MASGLLACALTPGTSNALLLAIGPSLCGAGFGIFQLANNRALFLDPPVARAAAAGGVQGTARLAGQTAGTLAMSLIFATTPVLVAPRIGFAAGVAATLLAALLSLLAGRVPARSSIQPCREQAAAA